MGIKIKSAAGGSTTIIAKATQTTDEVVDLVNFVFPPVIESGWGSSGPWTKFPDGTLICAFTSQTLNYDNNKWTYSKVWTFGANFVGAYAATMTTNEIMTPGGTGDGGAVVYKTESLFSDKCSIIAWCQGKFTGDKSEHKNVSAIAVGRWK